MPKDPAQCHSFHDADMNTALECYGISLGHKWISGIVIVVGPQSPKSTRSLLALWDLYVILLTCIMAVQVLWTFSISFIMALNNLMHLIWRFIACTTICYCYFLLAPIPLVILGWRLEGSTAVVTVNVKHATLRMLLENLYPVTREKHFPFGDTLIATPAM